MIFHRRKFSGGDEHGQSALIVMGGLVALIAFLAVVTDAGNAFAQRRQVQNAVDAGSQAGSIQLAQNKTNGQVDSAIQDYVSRNGVDPARVSSYYVTQDANGNYAVQRSQTIIQYGANSAPPKTISGLPVRGVQVEADKTFATFFAGVVGRNTLQVGAVSKGYSNQGACTANNVFPLVMSQSTFADENNDGIRDPHFENIDSAYPAYRLWENKTTDLSNFGYLTWNGDTSAGTLVSNMSNVSQSGTVSAGSNATRSTASMSSSSVRSQIQAYVNSGALVTVAVYDTASPSTNPTSYHIVGFARMHITGYTYNTSTNPVTSYINAKFDQWVPTTGEGGCPNYGVLTVNERPVMDLTRSLVGTVKLNKITLVNGHPITTHVPVDVVNVLDISGSMNDAFGSQSKIQAAKQALTAFNNNMLPAQGDQVALVTYPNVPSGTRYNFNCQQTGSTTSYYFGQVRNNLTSNVAAVNNTINNLTATGGTPIADGLRNGLLTVLGAGHNSNHVAVIILASDGLANIRINGTWTGFDGSTYQSLACNSQAVQDTLDQANLAKSDANHDGQPDTILFSIAVGNDFDPSTMQAIASPTVGSFNHYFHATDAGSMQSIYNQIANRVQQIGSETCTTISTEAFAPAATLSIRNTTTGTTYSVQTTSTGEFVIPNVQPGTFTVQSGSVYVDGFTYDVFTDGLGGAPLTSSPTVVVGTSSGTYKTDLFLKTNTPFSCPGS